MEDISTINLYASRVLVRHLRNRLLYGFSSRVAIIVVGFVLVKHFDGDFTEDKEISLSNISHRGTKAQNLAWHSTS